MGGRRFSGKLKIYEPPSISSPILEEKKLNQPTPAPIWVPQIKGMEVQYGKKGSQMRMITTLIQGCH